jgi:HK97 family phage portal protein
MQFLQTRQYTAAEIAGQMFLVDPSDLGIGVAGSSLTYANLADRNTRRVQVTLLPWITRIEHAVSSLMLRPRYMKFNVNALLRADLAARYSSYATGIGAGFLLPDEARELEDLPPLGPTDVEV